MMAPSLQIVPYRKRKHFSEKPLLREIKKGVPLGRLISRGEEPTASDSAFGNHKPSATVAESVLYVTR